MPSRVRGPSPGIPSPIEQRDDKVPGGIGDLPRGPGRPLKVQGVVQDHAPQLLGLEARAGLVQPRGVHGKVVVLPGGSGGGFMRRFLRRSEIRVQGSGFGIRGWGFLEKVEGGEGI